MKAEKLTDVEENHLPYGDDVEFSGNSIFFIETAPRGLNHREACSVVSAARAHPHRPINVLFTESFPMIHLKTQPLKALARYNNVKFYRINITTYSYDTPLERTIKNRLPGSKHLLYHKADILRYLTLYKFGGIYLDLDVIVVKNLDELPQKDNWVGKDLKDKAASSLLSISRRSKIGRHIIDSIVSVLSKQFNPKSWSFNSNGVLNKVLRANCGIKTGYPKHCKGFRIYEQQYFYPIPFSQEDDYFSYKFTDLRKLEINENTFAFHVWNRLTQKKKIHKRSLYAKLARTFCPEYTQRKRQLEATNITQENESALSKNFVKRKVSNNNSFIVEEQTGGKCTPCSYKLPPMFQAHTFDFF